MPNSQRYLRDLFLLLLAVVTVRALPRLVLGEDSYIPIHDNLDSDFVYRVLITRPGRLFDDAGTIPEMLGGQPRWTFPAALKLSSLAFELFKPFNAYVFLELVVTSVAAGGMWLLLTDDLRCKRSLAAAVAFLFSLLPYYPIYELSVAGQPLVAWAVLGLWTNRFQRASLAICAIYPFASILQMSGAFVAAEVCGAFLLGLYLTRRQFSWRRILWPAAGAFAVVLGYVVSEASFLWHFLFTNFVSQRSLFVPSGSLGTAHGILWAGSYHAASCHTPILVLVTASTLFATMFRRWEVVRGLCLGFLICGVLSYSSELFALPGFRWLTLAFPKLAQVTPRFWWTLPLAWYALLGFLGSRWTSLRLPRWMFGLFLLYQAHHILEPRHELRINYALLSGKTPTEVANPDGGSHENQEINESRLDVSQAEAEAEAAAEAAAERAERNRLFTYRMFESSSALKAIKHHVGKDRRRYIAFGFHPSVLHLAGMRTADGYRDNFPLEYHSRFRKLIADTLNGAPELLSTYDRVARRMYLPPPRVDYHYFASLSKRPGATARILRKPWTFDPEIAQTLDIGWVVSTYRLTAAGRPRSLRYEGTFPDPSGGFTFHLYRVDYGRVD